MNKIRVIIADDVEPILSYIESIISSYQEFELVAKAKDGNELFNYIKEYSPDLVVTDIGMPIYSGFEVISKVKEEMDNNIKYIVMTGNDDYDILKQANELGVSKVIKKPITDEHKFLTDLIDIANQNINLDQTESKVDINCSKVKNHKISNIFKRILGK